MDSIGYQPIGDRVLIRPKPKEDHIGKFILIEEEQKQEPVGEVVAVGDGIPLHNIKLDIKAETTKEALEELKEIVHLIQNGRPMRVKVGDYVQYGQFAGTQVKVNGETYLMLREQDIFGIMDKNSQIQ